MSDRLTASAFVAFVASAAVFRLSSYDIWWHLATGRLILSGGGIPHTDPFSFTAAGVKWIDHEWLFQVMVHVLHQLGGPPALVLAKAAVIAVAGWLVWRFVRRESRLPAAATAFLLVPFVIAGRDRFLVRPELFSLLFGTLLLAVLLDRERPPSLRRLWWVPPLFALWANLHAGVILGLLLIAAVAAGRLAEGLPLIGRGHGVDRREVGGLGLLLAASAAAGLANPFLHEVYLAPFRLTAIIASGVYDNLEWRPPSWSAQWLFYLLLAAAVVLALGGVRRRDWTALLPLFLVAVLAVRYVRNLAVFSLLAPMLLARLWAPEDEQESERKLLATLSPTVVVGLLAVLSVWLLTAGHRFPSGLGIDRRRVPVAGVDFIAEHRPPGNIYNVYGFGGYLSWRLWPDVKIFIDGRNEVFVELRRRLGEAVGDSRRWQQLLEDYEIGYALVSYVREREQVTLMDPEGGPARTAWWPYTVTHFPRRGWALLHFDDASMLFVRRSPESEALIARYELRHLFPADPVFQVEAMRMGWAEPAGALHELQQKLRDDPRCERAAALLDRVLGELNAPPGV